MAKQIRIFHRPSETLLAEGRPFIWFRVGIYGTHPDIEIQISRNSD
jgi:hypothetical protein